MKIYMIFLGIIAIQSSCCLCDTPQTMDSHSIEVAFYDTDGNWINPDQLLGSQLTLWLRNKSGIPEKVQTWKIVGNEWLYYTFPTNCEAYTEDFLLTYNDSLQLSGNIQFSPFYGGPENCCKSYCSTAFISGIEYGTYTAERQGITSSPVLIRFELN